MNPDQQTTERLLDGYKNLLVGMALEIRTLEERAERLKGSDKDYNRRDARTCANLAQRLRHKLARNKPALKAFFKTCAPEGIAE